MENWQTEMLKKRVTAVLRDGKAHNLSEAAEQALVSPATVRKWRRSDPEFRAATDDFRHGTANSDRIPAAENVATKAGRRAIADQIESICVDVDLVFTGPLKQAWGESTTNALTDELMEIAERLRE